jgi:hypothetical protein
MNEIVFIFHPKGKIAEHLYFQALPVLLIFQEMAETTFGNETFCLS